MCKILCPIFLSYIINAGFNKSSLISACLLATFKDALEPGKSHEYAKLLTSVVIKKNQNLFYLLNWIFNNYAKLTDMFRFLYNALKNSEVHS